MAGAILLNFQNIFRLDGKVAVVTGGARGLGLAAASGMLQAGASKVYVTSRTQKACDEACAQLMKVPNLQPGARAVPVICDASSVEGIKQMVSIVSDTTDHVDILLSNVGYVFRSAFEDHKEDEFSTVLDVNLKSAFYAVQALEPLLTKRASIQDPSRFIVTSSVSGVGLTALGPTGTLSYSAAKAGIIHLVKQLAVEIGPRNILSNCIAPGFFPTELAAPSIAKLGGEEAMAKTYPNGRLGRGEDFAATVVFLASRGGSHINGTNLVVDGGGVIGRVKR